MNKISLTKRQKIVITTVVITLGLMLTQATNVFLLRYKFVGILTVISLLLSIWALWEGLTKVKATMLLILPVMFTLGVASFYFLLPIRWLTRIPVAVLFGLSYYFLLLSQNVFNVAAERTIPLYRAASTVNFLFTLITAFFLFNVIFGLDLPFYYNFLGVGLTTYPLILQFLWSIEMDKISTPIMVYSLILALIVGECGLALSFWPIAPTMWSLSLSTLIYVLLGVVSEFFRERLNKRVVGEYILIGIGVLIFTIFGTSWTG